MDVKERAVSEARDIAANDLLGAAEWKRSKISWLLGLGPIAGAAKVSGRMVAEGAHGVASFFTGLLRPDEVEPLPTESADPVVRFGVAMEVHGRKASDIEEDVRATRKQFTLYFVLAVLAFSFGIASGHWGSRGMPLVIEALGRFSLVVPVIALTARMGFYNWQLRTRRLGSFREWLHSPSEWMPPSETPGGRGNVAALLFVGAVGAAVFACAPAYAQTNGGSGGSASLSQIFSTPNPAQDLWTMMLSFIFPNMDGLGGGMQTTQSQAAFAALSAAMGTFLSVLMALGGAMLSWHTLSGTVSTAHEGKVLGQRWHLVWAPVRVCTGYAMLAPVSNGFCLAQLLVLQLAIWGGSFGNALWGSYINVLANPTGQTQAVGQTIDPSVALAVRDLLELEVCRATGLIQASEVNNGVPAQTVSGGSAGTVASGIGGSQDNIGNMQTIYTDTQIAAPTPYSSSAWHFLFSDPNAIGFMGGAGSSERTYDYGICGAASITYLTGSGSTDLAARVSFENARLKALDALIVALRGIAIQIAQAKDPGSTSSQAPQPPSFSAVTQAATTYQNSVETAVNTLQSAMNGNAISTMKTQMQQAGWASAGMFYMDVTRLQNIYHDGLNLTINVKAPNLGNATREIISRLGSPELGTIPLFEEWWKAGVLNPGTGGQFSTAADAAKIDTDASGGTFQKVVKKIADSWAPNGLRYLLTMWQVDLSQGSSLYQMISVGHALMDGFWAGAAVLVATGSVISTAFTAAGSLLSANPEAAVGAIALHAVLVPFAGILQMLMIGLLSVGVTLAYVLPLMPYTQMLFLTVGMLILVVEAVVAAPLWAFFHIRMDGQEFVDQSQRQGYMISFNLLLRIPLAMMGLFFSFQVLDITMWFVSQTFLPAFLSVADGSSGFGLIGMFTGVVMMGYLNYQVAIRSFGLITALPDRVTRWFGAEDRTGDDSHAKDLHMAALGIINNRTGGVVDSAFKGAQGRGNRPAGGNTNSPPPTNGNAPGNDAGTQTPPGGETGKGGEKSAPPTNPPP
jgi:conjugal transfer/type IV secretion protein DotA/TraY